MRIIKKSFFISLFICLLFIFIGGLNVKAYNSASDSSGASTFTPSEITEQNISGMEHQIVKGNAVTNGANHGQYINTFTMKTDGVTSKLATWAVQSGNAGFTRTTITQAAADYEKANPGWKVLGGINADQYFFKFGGNVAVDGSWYFQPAPYYPMVSNGNKIFPISVLGNYQNLVGFKNDGSANSFATTPGIGGFVIEVIKEDGSSVKFPVAGFNKQAGSAQTTVWSGHYSSSYSNTVEEQTISTSNKVYLVEKADLAYMYNYSGYQSPYARDSFFGLGNISQAEVDGTKVGKGQFAIETTNQELKALLEVGARVKVEQEYTDPTLNNCDEVIGYHTCHRLNGEDIPTTAQYNKQQYSRALVGRKADGTYMLITADMVQSLGSHGLTATEINAVAEYYDLVDLYQMDGGGSVTAMVSTSTGFKVTNYPKDSGNPSNPRANLSYLFFVKRVPQIKVEKTTYHSITLTNLDASSNAISDIVVNCNGKQYTFNEPQLTIEGLRDETEYTIDFTYKINDGTTSYSSTSNMVVKTSYYVYPINPFALKAKTKTSFTFEKVKSTVSHLISNVVITCGGVDYTMGSNDEILIENLFEDTDYTVEIKYTIHDEVSNQDYEGLIEATKYRTLNYDLPSIDSFEVKRQSGDSVTLGYEYSDPSGIVVFAYIVYGDEKIDLSSDVGNEKISGLKSGDYEFKLVLEYSPNSATEMNVIESAPLSVTIKAGSTPSQKPASMCGAQATFIISLLSSVSLLAIVLKRKH